MDVKDAIEGRRSYRAFQPFEVKEGLILDLVKSARLAPSCYNNQPWRYVFVYDPETLKRLHTALSPGNEWAKSGSMIAVVFSRKEDDSVMADREYHQFDIGLATAFIILRATELGLVAHPIAGYSPEKVAEVLGIPKEYIIIALVIFGKHTDKLPDFFSEKQKEAERKRPPRKPIDEIVYLNTYTQRT